MARLAHWATTASRIKNDRGISWREAIEVYHALGIRTRKVHGRRPGLVDLDRHKRTVTRAVNRLAEELRLDDELGKLSGFEAARFAVQSLALKEAGLPAPEITRVVRVLKVARSNVKKHGSMSPTTKGRLRAIVDDWVELYGVDANMYYQITKKVYGKKGK